MEGKERNYPTRAILFWEERREHSACITGQGYMLVSCTGYSGVLAHSLLVVDKEIRLGKEFGFYL